MHVHLTDQTLRDNHGVVRTDAGSILLEQLHRYLIQTHILVEHACENSEECLRDLPCFKVFPDEARGWHRSSSTVE